jgi:hypothetical protein
MANTINYIGGMFYAKEVKWDNIPINSIIDSANPTNTKYSKMSGYHWVKFKKINSTQWQICSVWFVNKTKTYEQVENGEVYTLNEVLPMCLNNKKYTETRIHMCIPLYKENGDMNMLKLCDYELSEYHPHISFLELLKEVADYNSRTYIKFRFDNDNEMTINIIRGNNKYYIHLKENQYNEFCKKNNLKIRQDAFNTYF